MDWSESAWRDAFRIELRVQAIGLAARGWPVLPGTHPADAADPDALAWNGPAPLRSDWQEHRTAQPDEVTAWCTGEPHSLLLATGSTVEALEVDPELGARAAAVLRVLGRPAPIVATPDRRWYFLTAGGQHLPGELAESGRIRLHSKGSWVPMPPTTYPAGVVHWRVKPEVCAWRLPVPALVHDAMSAGLHNSENVVHLVEANR